MRVFTATALLQGTTLLDWCMRSGKKGDNLLSRVNETVGMQQMHHTGTYDEAKNWLISKGARW